MCLSPRGLSTHQRLTYENLCYYGNASFVVPVCDLWSVSEMGCRTRASYSCRRSITASKFMERFWELVPRITCGACRNPCFALTRAIHRVQSHGHSQFKYFTPQHYVCKLNPNFRPGYLSGYVFEKFRWSLRYLRCVMLIHSSLS